MRLCGTLVVLQSLIVPSMGLKLSMCTWLWTCKAESSLKLERSELLAGLVHEEVNLCIIITRVHSGGSINRHTVLLSGQDNLLSSIAMHSEQST